MTSTPPPVGAEDEAMLAARKKVEELLRQLREGWLPHDDSPETATDKILNALSHKDFPALRHVQAKLTVKAKDKKLDVFFLESHNGDGSNSELVPRCRTIILMARIFYPHCKGYGAWCQACEESPEMDQSLPSLRKASPPLLRHIQAFYP